MKGFWSGVSNIIEKEENRAKIEIFEEVWIIEEGIKSIKSTKKIKISLVQYENHEWKIFPFLF